MNKDEATVTCYTTAPKDYDYPCVMSSRTVGKDKRGREIRAVEIEGKHAEGQMARYGSGLHMAVDDAEWTKLLEYNLVTPAD